MFNLQQAIAKWRQKMLAAGITTPIPMEELELHLREEMERQVETGIDACQAFDIAVKSIGEAQALKAEFKKNPENLWNKFSRIRTAPLVWPIYNVLAMGFMCAQLAWMIFYDPSFMRKDIPIEHVMPWMYAFLLMAFGTNIFRLMRVWRTSHDKRKPPQAV